MVCNLSHWFASGPMGHAWLLSIFWISFTFFLSKFREFNNNIKYINEIEMLLLKKLEVELQKKFQAVYLEGWSLKMIFDKPFPIFLILDLDGFSFRMSCILLHGLIYFLFNKDLQLFHKERMWQSASLRWSSILSFLNFTYKEKLNKSVTKIESIYIN